MSVNPKTFQNVFTDESKGQFDELKVKHQGQMKDILTLLGSGSGGSGGARERLGSGAGTRALLRGREREAQDPSQALEGFRRAAPRRRHRARRRLSTSSSRRGQSPGIDARIAARCCAASLRIITICLARSRR